MAPVTPLDQCEPKPMELTKTTARTFIVQGTWELRLSTGGWSCWAGVERLSSESVEVVAVTTPWAVFVSSTDMLGCGMLARWLDGTAAVSVRPVCVDPSGRSAVKETLLTDQQDGAGPAFKQPCLPYYCCRSIPSVIIPKSGNDPHHLGFLASLASMATSTNTQII